MKDFSVGVLVLATGLTVAPLTANACATVFEHRDYGGASWYMEDFERLMMVDGTSTGCTTNGHGGG